MSTLIKYINKKAEFEQLKEDLEQLENSPELKKDIQFKDALMELTDKYDKSPKDLLNILVQIDPSLSDAPAEKGARKKRPMLTYKNPHTGEVVKTRGGNHKTLKEWREKYGKDTVDQWKETSQ